MSLESKKSDYHWIDFDNDMIKNLHRLLEEADNIPYAVAEERHGVWFTSAEENVEAELRLLTFLKDSVIVSRVHFCHKRCGVMTKVFAELKEFCQKSGFKRIVIQSVQTPEMASWCAKNGFKPNSINSHSYNGFITGDWDYKL